MENLKTAGVVVERMQKWYYDFSTVKMYDLNDWLELSSKIDTPEMKNEHKKAPF